MADNLQLIIAGGGTGGHLFPGIAIGKEVQKRCPGSKVLFVTSKKKLESEILTRSGFLQKVINVQGIKGKGVFEKFLSLIRLPISFVQSVVIIKKFKPGFILGVGGYSSGPVCLAGRLMGVPTAVHEQNSFPGLTNRLLCRIVNRVFVSFKESKRYFSGGDIYVAGNPVREGILEIEKKNEFHKPLTLLVMGGSQGASSINKAFLNALEIMQKKGEKFSVIHQTGVNDLEELQEGYKSKGLEGALSSFIDDMVGAYAKADIVISRAGATTVAELTALGKPSILIPYPYAANDHQLINAMTVVMVGGAEIILEKDLNGEAIAEKLIKQLEDPEGLKKMGTQASKVGRRDATRMIVNNILSMTGNN